MISDNSLRARFAQVESAKRTNTPLGTVSSNVAELLESIAFCKARKLQCSKDNSPSHVFHVFWAAENYLNDRLAEATTR